MTDRNKSLKIQDRLPLRAVGIETEREQKNFSDKPPQNYIHVWWARRPTPATRLAILSSVLPSDVDEDTLLDWMGISPKNKANGMSISEHVEEKRRTVDDASGRIYDHYGYKKCYKNLPDSKEMEKLHSKAKETWGGKLPTVLDATAGGGSIPFESIRYGFPTIANELNSVASVILKGVLEHPRIQKDITEDIEKWGGKINEKSSKRLSEFFNSPDGQKPLEYLWSHVFECPDCGCDLPLAPNWWLHKESSNEGVAAKPRIQEESSVDFEVVRLPEDVEKSEYNPTDGTVSYGKATCLNCSVTIETEEIRQQARDDNIDLQLYAVHYEDQHSGKKKFRAPTAVDERSVEKARQKVDSSPELLTFLSDEIPEGYNTNQPRRYGITEWRDMFTPRQLVVHHTYLESFEEVKPKIQEEYEEEVANAILTYLSIAADKALDYNSRMCSWHPNRAVIGHTFERQDFAFRWSIAESNLTAEGLGYEWALSNTVEAYETLRDLSNHSKSESSVLQSDAASLPLNDGEVDAIVMDPPYYDNVMYSEISDFFYVWQREYLGDIYPSFFESSLVNKDEEAVANSERFDDVAGGSTSKVELAKNFYENKMESIFSEGNRVLDEDGIITIMFTHKKTEAWDTLTKSLIKSEFIVNSTHPINTESPLRLGQKGKNSADSTILLAAEKRKQESGGSTLWSDVQRETRQAAVEKASELDQREVNFSKVDMMLASFGPTLESFTRNYPVVDDEGNEVEPQRALDEARDAVRDYLIEQYLNDGVQNVDPKSEWYLLSWFIFEAEQFPYDEARRLAIGVGEELDDLKKTHRMWRKRSGDIILRPCNDRVQDVNKDPDDRSGRIPVDPDALSFATDLDKVHAAMHVYDAKGATAAWNWMSDRNCGSDPAFRAILEALLRVLPHSHDDWELARDLAVGETGDLLDLDLDAGIFQTTEDDTHKVQGSLSDF